MTAFLLQFGDAISAGQPAPAHWEDALAKLAYRGPHGLSTITVEHARFSAANRRLSQRDRDLRQPLVERDSRVVVVFDGRLDAARDLAASLGIPQGGPLPADTELVAKCYLRHGEDFLARLDGEFALALYDINRRTLIAARDMFGSRMLYWAKTSTGLYLSNELPAIRTIPGVDDALDHLAVADYLILGLVDTFDKARTPFRGIHALPPANCLSATGASQQIHRYRHFLQLLRPVPGIKPREAPEAFREAMSAAVAERLDVDRAVIPLSGGLDSTTIAATAVRVCRSGHAQSRLKFWTGLDSADDEESTFARSAATHLGVPQEFVLTNPESLLARPRPSWYPATHFFVNAQDDPVDRMYANADIVLYGCAADSAVYPEQTTLLELLRVHGSRHALHAWRTLRAQCRSISFGTGFRRGRIVSDRVVVNRMLHLTNLPIWLNREFAADCNLDERLAESLRWRPPDELHSVYPNAQFLLQWSNWFYGSFPVDTVYSPPEWTDPFLDHRVLSVLFALPPEPWRFRKFLLREAGRGLLPDDLLARPKVPGGNFVARWINALDRSAVDDWQLSPALASFIDRAAVPPIDMAIEGTNAYLNFRPLMLQRWYSRLRDW